MDAEIIAVGSEMLTPDHVDTNSLFITELLNEAGFEVRFKTVVGDDERDLEGVVRTALDRSTLIIVTGGLGPTEDDLTRTAVASVLRRSIRVDPALVDALRKRFASRGYRMAAINERQAEVIAGAEVLPNSNGTAPGMWIEDAGRVIALLPGPPREARPMLENSVLPLAARIAGGKSLARRTIHIANLTESEVDSRVSPLYRACPQIRTTILAGTGQITLKLQRWLSPGESPVDLDKLVLDISDELGDTVFSASGESIEAVVGKMLRDSGKTLAVAESCTAGLIGMRITRIPGSSSYFLGGVLCYSNESKISMCRVPREVIDAAGAVSAEVAESLAQGIRTALGSSVGLSITGIAGPGGGSAEKPVGLVYVGTADANRVTHYRRIVPGDRDTVRERAGFFALSSLRRFLLPDNPK